MTTIKIRKSKTIRLQHIIFEDNPSIKSRAAYLLLKERLLLESDEKDELKEYLNFRENFMNKKLKEGKGILTCVYCGRKDLVKGSRKNHKHNNSLQNLATIDHVIPVSKGGPKLDEKNCVVSCRSCNSRKGNSLDESYRNTSGTVTWSKEQIFNFIIEYIVNGAVETIKKETKAVSKSKAKRNTHRWFSKNYNSKDIIQIIPV